MTGHTTATTSSPTERRSSRRGARAVLAAGALAVMLGGCACGCSLPTQSAQGGNGGTAARSAQQATGNPTGAAAVTLDGAPASVPVPGKPTVVYFYAVGCASCAQALHDIGATRAAAPPGTAYQAVDVNPVDRPADIRAFLADARTDGFALLRDPANRLAATYGVTALGTTVVFDAAGRQVWRGIDPSTATLAAVLRAKVR